MIRQVIFSVLVGVMCTLGQEHRPENGKLDQAINGILSLESNKTLANAAGGNLLPTGSKIASEKKDNILLPLPVRVARASKASSSSGGGKRPASPDQGGSKKASKGNDGGKNQNAAPKIQVQPATPGTTPPGSPIPIAHGGIFDPDRIQH